MHSKITHSARLDVHPARDAAALAVARAFDGRNLEPIAVDPAGLEARDAALAQAIARTVARRWLTLNFIIDRCLDKPRIEPALRSLLATAAAQLLFMHNQPAHAVVDITVEQAKQLVRPGAAGLANAVLRRVPEMIVERRPDTPWEPANNTIPLGAGEGTARLLRKAMLKPRRLDRYLSIATSHDQNLVAAWLERHGQDQAIALLLRSLVEPPTLVHAPAPGSGGGGGRASGPGSANPGQPHEQPPFIVWDRSHAELVAFLEASPDRWVQDPSAYRVVRRIAELRSPPELIVDYCAGRGTKTRALSCLLPEVTIIATDPDAARFADLVAMAEKQAGVQAVSPDGLGQWAGHADLLLLDVPCSNTGVLARRPEARYRYSRRNMESVVELQRTIIREAAPLLRPGGTLVYSTCSIEPPENQHQAAWAADQLGMDLIADEQMLPAGRGASYHDGAYHAILTRRA